MINTINIFPTQHALQSFNQSSATNKIIKAKQSTIDMSYENKLTNLVFKNKENSARTQCATFFLPFSLFFLKKKLYRIKKTPRMKCMDVMQCNSQRQKKNTKPKNKEQWSQRKSNKAQGPCQKDSVSLSLLHPKLFRRTTSIGVCIHIRVISNSKIGIKVECLY